MYELINTRVLSLIKCGEEHLNSATIGTAVSYSKIGVARNSDTLNKPSAVITFVLTLNCCWCSCLSDPRKYSIYCSCSVTFSFCSSAVAYGSCCSLIATSSGFKVRRCNLLRHGITAVQLINFLDIYRGKDCLKIKK